jgi:hypothetical protein
MRKHHPEGRRLPALERNILKYRAFEMVIFLFHAESLKRFVLGAVRATSPARFPSGMKRPVERAFAYLVDDGILTANESADIQELIDFRNSIGHRVHELTADLSRDPVAEDFVAFGGSKYLPGALRKLMRYEHIIEKRLASKYIMPLSFDHLVFEAAEKVYRREMTRLDKAIRWQIETRTQKIAQLNREIDRIQPYISEAIEPDHPLNVARNGTLTNRGNAVCSRLFALELSDLAVAHLMRVSLRAIKRRRQLWSVQR